MNYLNFHKTVSVVKIHQFNKKKWFSKFRKNPTHNKNCIAYVTKSTLRSRLLIDTSNREFQHLNVQMCMFISL